MVPVRWDIAPKVPGHRPSDARRCDGCYKPGDRGSSPVLPTGAGSLPWKLAVRGLPGAKRRDVAVGRALDRELSRRQDRPAREDGPAALAGAAAPGVRDGGWPGWRRVRGNGAAAAARAVRPHAEAAGQAAAPQRRDSPATPAAYGAALPDSASTSPVLPRPLHEPGRGRTARRA
jgi:hypothetical protein